jgi:hypothetical protein
MTALTERSAAACHAFALPPAARSEAAFTAPDRGELR